MHGLHRASWKTTSVTFTPPKPPSDSTRHRASEDSIMMYEFGFSVIKQECTKCGLARVLTTPGGVREEPLRPDAD